MPVPVTDLTTLANDLRLACQRISRRVRFEGTQVVAPHQFSVLVRLRDTAATPTELAEVERVSTPSMTRTVNGLVELGYVARQPHPSDRRQVLVELTSAGREVVEQILRDRDTWMMQRLSTLSPEQLHVLQEATDVLREVAAQ